MSERCPDIILGKEPQKESLEEVESSSGGSGLTWSMETAGWRSWSMENAAKQALDKQDDELKYLEKRMSEFGESLSSTSEADWGKGGSSSKLIIDNDASTAASFAEFYNKQELQRIKNAVSFQPLKDRTYRIVEELFPQAHPGAKKQRVFLARWNDDGKQVDRYVIVKWRSKERGFKDSWDHKEWIRAMKMLYYYSNHHDGVEDVLDKRISTKSSGTSTPLEEVRRTKSAGYCGVNRKKLFRT